MIDLLENYVIVSPDCSGMWIYSMFYPDKDRNFINYNTPLTAHLFQNDWDFILFCEKYDEYVSQEPGVDEALPGYKIEGFRERIRMIHEPGGQSSERHMKSKWNGRAELGKRKKKIFIWSAGAFTPETRDPLTFHSDEQRKELIERFKKLNGYSIFITEKPEEACEGKDFIVHFLPEWKDKTQSDREGSTAYYRLKWNINFGAEGVGPLKVFKKIIETYMDDVAEKILIYGNKETCKSFELTRAGDFVINII